MPRVVPETTAFAGLRPAVCGLGRGVAVTTERLSSIDRAAELIRSGGVVAFPTETVYGLGVDATNADAVERLFAAKGRPSDNPLIVHVADVADWRLAASELTTAGEALLARYAPGPITVVLPKQDRIASAATAGLETVGVRVPSLPIARDLLRRAGVPVAAPSANRSGRPSCVTWRSVLEDLDGRIDAVLCHDAAAEDRRIGLESTVVDCSRDPPALLRPGAITLEQIAAIVPTAIDASIAAPASDAGEGPAASPGVRHPHYQPRASVTLVDSPTEALAAMDAAYAGINGSEGGADGVPTGIGYVALFPDVARYAASYYEFLREADRRGIARVYVQRAPAEGLGRALLDRQRRSAGES